MNIGTLEIELMANIARLQGDMNNATRSVGGAMSNIQRAVNVAKNAFVGLAAGMGVQRVLAYADAWGQLSSRMALATGSMQAGSEALSRLADLSNRVYKPVESISELFISTSKTLDEMGYSSDQTMKMVEALAYSLTVSGADAQKSASVMDAWAKALLVGKLGMDELTTVITNAPRLQQALAESLGTTNEGLMQIVLSGGLSRDMMMRVGEQAQKLGAETDQMPVSMADAFVKLSNNLFMFFGYVDGGAGVIKSLTSAMDVLSESVRSASQWIDTNRVALTLLTEATITAAKIAAGYFAIMVAAPVIYAAMSGAVVTATGAVALYTYNLLFTTTATLGFNVALFGTSVAANLATGAVTRLQLALGILFAAFAGWQVGTYLTEQFQTVRLAGLTMVGLMLRGFENLKTGALLAGAAIASLAPWTESYADAKTRLMAEHAKEIALIDENIVGLMAYELQTKTVAAEEVKAVVAKASVVTLTKEQIEAAKAAAKAFEASSKQARDFITSLQQQTEELGLNEEQVKMLTAARAAALAPTAALRLEIMQTAMASVIATRADKLSTEATDALKAANQALLDVERQRISQYEGTVSSMADANKSMREEIELIGLTDAAQLAVTQARISSVIAIKEEHLARLQNSQFMGREQIALEEEIRLLRERQTLQGDRGLLEATKRINDAQLSEQKKTVEQIDEVFRAGFANMVNGGTDTWTAFSRSLVTTFKTTVADQIYKMFAQPFVVKIVASLLGITGAGVASAAGAAGGGSSLLGAASNIYSLSTSFAGGVSAAVSGMSAFTGALMAPTGMVASLQAAGVWTGSAAATAATTAGASAGVSAASAFAAIPGWGWAALAAAAVLSYVSGRGETRHGGQYNNDGVVGNTRFTGGPSGGEINGTFARDAFAGAQAQITDYLKLFGSTATLAGYQAALESSENGKGFVGAGGHLSTGATFGDQGSLHLANRGSMTAEQAMDSYINENRKAVLAALQAATDLPKAIASQLQGVDLGASMTVEQLTALEQSINKVVSDVQEFSAAMQFLPFEHLKTLSFDAASGLIAAAGGLEALGTNLGGFYTNFFTEAEQTAQLTKNTTAAFAAIGQVMPTLDSGARAAYRAMVLKAEAELDGTEATAKAYAGLLALQGPMSQLAPAFEAVSTSLTQVTTAIVDTSAALAAIAAANTKWQNQLDILTGASTARAQSLAADLAGATDASTRSLINQVYAQEDLQAATAALAVALQNQSTANAALRDSVAAAAAALVQAAAADAMGYAAVALTAAQNAFAGVTRSVGALKDAATELYKTQGDAIRTAIDNVKNSLSGLVGLSGRLQSTLDALRPIQSEPSYRADAQATLAAALAAARAGGGLPTDNAALDRALQTLAQPSEGLFTSFEAYAKDFHRTSNDIAALSGLTDDGITDQQKMQATLEEQLALMDKSYVTELAALESTIAAAQLQINGLTGIDTSITTLSSAMATYTSAISTAASAQSEAARLQAIAQAAAAKAAADKLIADAAALSSGNAIADAQAVAAAATLRTATAAAELLANYQSILGRGATGSEIASGASQFAGGTSSASIAATLRASSEGQISSVYQSALGRTPDATGMAHHLSGISRGDLTLAQTLAGIRASSEATVMTWYRNHPDQIDKNPSIAARGAWINALDANGLSNAKSWFANAVAEGYGKPVRPINSFEVGANFIPMDMQANLHAGERATPAADNRELMARLASPQGNSAALADAFREVVSERDSLREEVKGMRADLTLQNRQIAVNTKKMADALEKIEILGLKLRDTKETAA